MHNTTKLAGIAGIAWAGSNIVLGFSTGEPPGLDASGADVAAYLTDNRGVLLAAVAVYGATLPLLFVFSGELRRRLLGHGDGLAGSVVNPAVTTLAIGTAFAYLLLLPFIFGDGLGTDASDGMLRYAYVLTFAVSLIANIGGATLVAAASSVQSSRARSASLAAAGLVLVASVAGLANPEMALIGGLGLFVIAIWAVVVGVAMVREPVAVSEPAFSAA